MAAFDHVTIRVSPEELARIDAAAQRLRDAGLGALGNVTRSSVMRLAMNRGLDVLEAEGTRGAGKAPPARRRR